MADREDYTLGTGLSFILGGNSMLENGGAGGATKVVLDFGTAGYSIGTACLVCGKAVLGEGPKICDKCKAAIMAMREGMEGAGDNG